MTHCVECEMTNDYPCEKWGACPFYDEDWLEKIIEKQGEL